MQTIGNFLDSHKELFLATTLAIPIAIEATSFIHKIWTNRDAIKEKIYYAIDYIQAHPLKCLALLVAGAAIATGAFFGAAYIAPLPLAVMVALSVLYVIGKTYCNRAEIWQKIASVYTRMDGETEEAARVRIRNNIIKTVVAVVFITAISVTMFYLIHSGILLAALKKTTIGQEIADMIAKAQAGEWFNFPPSFLKLIDQTWFVVTAYSAVGVCHFYQAYKAYKKDDKAKALFHLFAGVIGFTAIGMMATGISEFRFHHIFYGLCFMFCSSRILKLFGTAVAADGVIWWLRTDRSWDLINFFESHIMLYLTFLGCMLLFEWITDSAAKSVSANSTDHNHTSTAPEPQSVCSQRV